MRIRYFLNAEIVNSLQVHPLLGDLELRNGLLSVVDRQEPNQFLEVRNFLVRYLNARLQVQHCALLLIGRLEH